MTVDTIPNAPLHTAAVAVPGPPVFCLHCSGEITDLDAHWTHVLTGLESCDHLTDEAARSRNEDLATVQVETTTAQQVEQESGTSKPAKPAKKA